MSLMEEQPGDAARRAGLRRMRILATSLLVIAAVIFIATLGREEASVWGFVNTAAEAAMVGALADWFAVTALFKHPLGLPIPHTALIPKRKDEFGKSLEEFVTENFLTESIVRDRIAEAQVGVRVGEWLSVPANRDRIMVEATKAVRAGVLRLKDEEVEALVTDLLLPRLVREPVSPMVGTLLENFVAQRSHDGLVDLALEQLGHWLADNPNTYFKVVSEKAPWWSPPWVDDKVIGWSYDQVLSWLHDIRSTPSHPARKAFDDLLARVARDLQHDPVTIARMEELKEALLTHPQVPKSAVAIWGSVRVSLIDAIDDRTSYYWRRGDELLEHAGTHLLEDPVWRERLETQVADAASFMLTTYGDELMQVISATVKNWDGQEASKRIELYVGRDLQFIRINGTVVGALAGLVIHTIAVALS